MMVQDRISERIEALKGINADEDTTPEFRENENSSKLPLIRGESYALKVINKSVLRSQEINVIRGESKILNTLVGRPNVV